MDPVAFAKLMVSALLATAAAVGESGGLRAQPAAAQVLVLDTEATLVGKIDRIDGGYRVQGTTGETRVPAAKALRLCNSLPEAYEYLRSRANRRDPDESMRLARWCWLNGLADQARLEVENTLRLQPRHAEAQRFLKLIEFAATPAAETTAVQASSTPAADESPASPETLQMFSRRVQPILTNACGACHTGGKQSGFDLLRPLTNGQYTQVVTRKNLGQAMKQIDRESPESSPVLKKALEAHGGGIRPPLASGETPAYRALESWVQLARGLKPRVPPSDSSTADSESRGQEGSTEESGAFASQPTTLPALPARATKAEPTVGSPGTTPTGGAARVPPPPAPPTPSLPLRPGLPVSRRLQERPPPPRTPNVPADPFDPAAFNRQFHPKGD